MKVGVVGATGLVGREIIKALEELAFPVSSLKAMATSRSAGSRVMFKGEELTVVETREQEFTGLELVFFAGGDGASEVFAELAVKKGAVVIDNSKYFRMREDVPLIVPEVNPHAVKRHRGLIANPNCSTIQMVVALGPIHSVFGIRRIVVSTYQSVSGTGREAVEELENQVRAYVSGQPLTYSVYPSQIAFNVLPQIGKFDSSGYSEEELKMIFETRKILEDEEIAITATTVRVPVLIGHAESVNIQTKKAFDLLQVKELLKDAKGVVFYEEGYPLPLNAAGRDEVFVGRLRKDYCLDDALEMWVVADNLRKGAAVNAVQIAQLLN